MAIADYHASAGDWRAQLKKNQRRTRQVIALFLLIYLLVGVVADTVMMSSMQPNLPIDQIFIGLLTFKYTPVATLIILNTPLLRRL